MTAVVKTDNFYNWFKDAGGNMVSEDPEKLNKNLLSIPLQRASTLKTDPQAIKEKYNHKFQKNESHR